jgi:hypothetical protein
LLPTAAGDDRTFCCTYNAESGDPLPTLRIKYPCMGNTTSVTKVIQSACLSGCLHI